MKVKKGTGKLRYCSFHETIKDKIKGFIETKTCDEVLIKHYKFILKQFDRIVAGHDKEIAKIEVTKADLKTQFEEAPDKLKQLNRHLEEMLKKIGDTKDIASGRKQKISRVKSLKERLATLQQECEEEGIDIEQAVKDLNKKV